MICVIIMLLFILSLIPSNRLNYIIIKSLARYMDMLSSNHHSTEYNYIEDMYKYTLPSIKLKIKHIKNFCQFLPIFANLCQFLPIFALTKKIVKLAWQKLAKIGMSSPPNRLFDGICTLEI